MATNATTQIALSGSTQGKGIKVAAVATAGTVLHTTGVSATIEDQVWLYVYNDHTANVEINVEFGGVTVPDNIIRQTIPFKQGMWLLVPGFPLYGTGSVGATVAAFATTTANVLVVYGYVNRITP